MEIQYVPAQEVRPHPRNARQGDVGAIVESIRANGLYRPLYVQRSTGYILAGNHTFRALLELGHAEVPVVYVDADDDQALRILLVDNRASDLGTYDQRQLAEMLVELATASEQALSGTGYDADDLDLLLKDLSEGLDLTDVVSSWQQQEAERKRAAAEQAEAIHQEKQEELSRTLAERFVVPPFSVLDARQGYWQARKRAWLSLGIRSEVGRPRNLLKFSETALEATRRSPNSSTPASDSGNDPQFYYKKQQAEARLGRPLSTEEFIEEHYEGPDAYLEGTSVFDPVLCEIAYRWYCPPGGAVLDPFAGGSVRGVVASHLGLAYTGIELRPEQIEANQEQAQAIGRSPLPRYIQGSAAQLPELCSPEQYDLVFTCPPYWNLERYSDDPADLSTLQSYEEFDAAMRAIWTGAAELLRPDRFAVVVMGNVREGELLHDLAGDMTRSMEAAGLQLYMDAVLVTAIGSLALRAARNFARRKLGRSHQQVLVYLKGDVGRALEALGELEIADPAAMFGHVVEERSE